MAERLLKVTEAADRLGVGRTTVYALMASGSLPSVRIGRRRAIRETDLDAFVRGLADERRDLLPVA